MLFLRPEPSQNIPIFKQNYTLKLFRTFRAIIADSA